jgi:taurine dioxygenase
MEAEILPNKAGVILRGLDLSKKLTESAFQEIYGIYLQWANIIITGQHHVSSDEYISFCGRFGEIISGVPATSHHKKYSKVDVDETIAPKYTLPGYPEIYVISNIERQDGKPTGLSKAGLYWHSDLYYTNEPSKITFLLSKELPCRGGDTLLLNNYEVYAALPKALKEKLFGLWMHHSWTSGWPYTFPNRAPLSEEECAMAPDVEHPLVGQHPETQRHFLFPGALYDFQNPGIRLKGLSRQESISLYEKLKDFTLNDRFIDRHKWSLGDIVATDNLAGMHCATNFNEDTEKRTIHRVTIRGKAPLEAQHASQ